jgi:hypothetical protein
VVVAVGLGAYWLIWPRRAVLGVSYVNGRNATLWSTTAQVREATATLAFGDRLEILDRDGGFAEVRTAKGQDGWVDMRSLVRSDEWEQAMALLAKAKQMPVEAQGHTKVVSNLRTEPKRQAERVLQLSRDVPVDFLQRQVADVPIIKSDDTDDEDDVAEPRKEDWWLVRAKPRDQGEIAGWVLGRFLTVDLPSPLPDYVSGAGIHPVAWFVLEQVPDSSGGVLPEYLVLGTHGNEGLDCDFTVLRVYSPLKKRAGYGTAYVESNVCGHLPLQLVAATHSGDQALFQFRATDGAGRTTDRKYAASETSVHRVNDDGVARAGAPKARRAAKPR